MVKGVNVVMRERILPSVQYMAWGKHGKWPWWPCWIGDSEDESKMRYLPKTEGKENYEFVGFFGKDEGFAWLRKGTHLRLNYEAVRANFLQDFHAREKSYGPGIRKRFMEAVAEADAHAEEVRMRDQSDNAAIISTDDEEESNNGGESTDSGDDVAVESSDEGSQQDCDSEDLDCCIIFARMNEKDTWWPSYRCEATSMAPRKPPTGKGEEWELVAFYDEKKHLLAWVKPSDIRPFRLLRTEMPENGSARYRRALDEADGDYAKYIESKREVEVSSWSSSGMDGQNKDTSRRSAKMRVGGDRSRSNGSKVQILGVGSVPNNLFGALKPGKKGFVLEVMSRKRLRKPSSTICMGHADRKEARYSSFDSLGQPITEPSMRPQMGMQIMADFQGTGAYYKGVISKVNKNGTYDIAYDDGDCESGKTIDAIRILEGREHVIEGLPDGKSPWIAFSEINKEEGGAQSAQLGEGSNAKDLNRYTTSNSSSMEVTLPGKLAPTLKPGRKGFVGGMISGRRERVPTQHFATINDFGTERIARTKSKATKKSIVVKKYSVVAKGKCMVVGIDAEGQQSNSTAKTKSKVEGHIGAKKVLHPGDKVTSSKKFNKKMKTFEENSRVEVRWLKGQFYYAARIAAIKKKDDKEYGYLYDIEYDDGEWEYDVEQRFIRAERKKEQAKSTSDKASNVKKASKSIAAASGQVGENDIDENIKEKFSYFDRRSARIKMIDIEKVPVEQFGKRAKDRFERYKAASTVDEFIRCGGVRSDFERLILLAQLQILDESMKKEASQVAGARSSKSSSSSSSSSSQKRQRTLPPPSSSTKNNVKHKVPRAMGTRPAKSLSLKTGSRKRQAPPLPSSRERNKNPHKKRKSARGTEDQGLEYAEQTFNTFWYPWSSPMEYGYERRHNQVQSSSEGDPFDDTRVAAFDYSSSSSSSSSSGGDGGGDGGGGGGDGRLGDCSVAALLAAAEHLK